MKKYGYGLLSILLIFCLLFAVGCDGTKEPQDVIGGDVSDTEADDTQKESGTDTDGDTTAEVTEKDGFSEEGSIALNSFRQSMVGTPELFGVAYLGYISEHSEKLGDELLRICPTLCSDLPFITEISDECIIGGEIGEIYCIVPLDENATVAVNGAVVEDGVSSGYENVLYRSEKGDPIILICNGNVFSPDTQLTVTNSSKNSITWYPKITDSGELEKENGTCSENSLCDFTPYAELMWKEYITMKDSFWALPDTESLNGTVWSCEEYKDNGDVHYFNLKFNENTADVVWNNDGEEHEYKGAKWMLTYDEGVSLIIFDFGEFAGTQTCAVLVSADMGMLYTCTDFVEGYVQPGTDSAWSRTLERVYG